MMIGLVAAEWSNLEIQLSMMFAIATGEVIIKGATESIKTQPTAAAAMSALESMSARLGVIENSLKRVLPEFVAEFEKLAAAIRKCAGARNGVVHASWSVSDRYPNDAIKVGEGYTYMLYAQRDFDEILTRIINQTAEISTFMFKCQDARIEHARAQQ